MSGRAEGSGTFSLGTCHDEVVVRLAALASLLPMALLGCRAHPPDPPKVSCPAQVEEFRHWMQAVAADGDVLPEVVKDPADEHHYLDRHLPAVPLVHVDASPAPNGLALLTLHRGLVQFADESASAADVAATARIVALDGSSVLSPSFGFDGTMYHGGLLWVGATEPWRNVVTVVDAMAREGFTEVSFAFAATTTAAEPPAVASLLALANDAHEMPWRRDEATARELARLNAQCPAVAAAFASAIQDSHEAELQREAFVADAPGAVAACACHADLAAIRAFTWTRFGRQWGPATRSYPVKLASAASPPVSRDGQANDAADEIAAPPDASWDEVHLRVIAAAARAHPARFVAR